MLFALYQRRTCAACALTPGRAVPPVARWAETAVPEAERGRVRRRQRMWFHPDKAKAIAPPRRQICGGGPTAAAAAIP
eukprot:121624-Pelagomonas_calceolata.AAC.2